jgi:hypothetical protein
MYVNLFPLVGIASLLIILPARPQPSPPRTHKVTKKVQGKGQASLVRTSMICLFSLWLVLESARVTVSNAMPWENKLMVVPAWRMFADGGVSAGGKWRLILDTPQGDVDATDISLQLLPHLWRDRFYIDTIFHDILSRNTGAGSLVDRLVHATEKIYFDRQIRSNGNPIVLRAGFQIYRLGTPGPTR